MSVMLHHVDYNRKKGCFIQTS